MDYPETETAQPVEPAVPVSRLLRQGLAPLLILAGGVLGHLWLSSLKATPTLQDQEVPPPLVETAPVTALASHLPLRVHGTVVPKREVQLVAEVAGSVVEKAAEVRAGAFVSKGQKLLRIDPRRYEWEVAKLQSELDQDRADQQQLDIEEVNVGALLEIAEGDLALVRRELDRLERLAKSNAASASERDQYAGQVIKARNALQLLENQKRLFGNRRARLQAAIALTEARLKIAQLDLEKTVVTAPFDGIIVEEHVEADVFVQPGTALFKLEDTAAVEVRCPLRIDDLYWLWNGADRAAGERRASYEIPRVEATVSYELAGRTYRWKGELARYEGVGVNEQTRTVPCRVEVPQPVRPRGTDGPPALVRGMFVTVTLSAAPRQPLLEAPTAALRPGDEVWCVRDGRLRLCKVRVARRLPEAVLVHADGRLRAGDAVITSPLDVAVDDMPVREVQRSGAR